jgi:hypothetical protein
VVLAIGFLMKNNLDVHLERVDFGVVADDRLVLLMDCFQDFFVSVGSWNELDLQTGVPTKRLLDTVFRSHILRDLGL